ncbi:glycoside hydrolase family 25 protein [Lachnospiraceae bacterium JLR.KK008]
MDSKTKTLTVVCVVLMMLLILGTVVGINVWQDPEILTSTPAAEQKETDVAPSSGQTEEAIDYSAFLGDETFFDQDKTDYEKLLENSGKKLSLLATSVEKDLRVQVLNELGELVTGEELFITLNGQEYKDLDQDGIIYIGDLSSGEYEVALREVGDYKVPSTPLLINVKEKVEYIPIDDISLLIKTEDEIDAEKEDTEAGDAADDADKTEMTDIQQSEENRSFGIDVSKWNKDIDWEKARAAGVEFAIIRCGYRGSSTGTLVEDPYFYRNIEGARAAGVKIGLYFFTQATNAVEAVEEASMVLCLNDGRPLDYPIFIDTEGAGGNGRADGLDTVTRTEVVEAFCETIENAGYRAGIYASRNWYYNKLDMTRLDSNVIWLAEYREYPKYEGKYQIWQYTSNGSIDGIEGRVDFNISYWNETE